MAGILGLIGAAAGLGPGELKVPEYNPVDPQKAQKTAISGNIAALPDAEKLASALNTFNQSQLEALLAKAIPNYAKIKEQTSANILSMLKGDIPDATQIATRSAERAVGGGFGGSEAARNLTLRDLSISSLKYTTSGIDAATRWLSSGAGGGVINPANPAAMFISPSQQIDAEFKNNENQWNRNWLKAQVDAEPSYLQKQAMGTLDYFDSLGKSALSFLTGASLAKVMGGSSTSNFSAPANQGYDSNPFNIGASMYS